MQPQQARQSDAENLGGTFQMGVPAAVSVLSRGAGHEGPIAGHVLTLLSSGFKGLCFEGLVACVAATRLAWD